MATRQGRGWALRYTTVVAAFVAAFGVSSASAQQDDQARARASFQLGVERFGDGSYESALEAFQEAYRLRPHPAVRVNMANCYERLGRPVEALFHYERFLTEAPPDLLAGRQAEVRRAIAALERQVGQLVLEVAPAAARVRIDGELVQVGSTPIRLIAGDHRLEVTADGYRPHSETFRSVAGERTTVTVELRRGTGGGATAVSVSSDSGALPSRDRGRTGARAGATRAGGAGAATAEPPEATEPVDEPVTGGGSRFLSTPFLISGGAAIALFLGGTVTGALALGAESDFDATASRIERRDYDSDEELQSLQQQGRDDASSADTLALTSDILLVSSLVAGGFAVYFLVTYEEDDGGAQRASARLRAVPVAGPNVAGFVLSGDF